MSLNTTWHRHWKQLFIPPGSILITCLFLAALVLSHGTANAADATLSVTLLGTGGGSVNSSPTGTNPVGINCIPGDSSACSTTFTSGTPVTLTAITDWKSIFTGWGLSCSGTGDCLLTINANTSITATFDVNGQAKVISGHNIIKEYGSLQDAYDAANNPGIVAARIYTFTESLSLSRPITVTLDLGKAADYLSPATGYTTLQGSLTIAQGTVRISNLIIK